MDTLEFIFDLLKIPEGSTDRIDVQISRVNGLLGIFRKLGFTKGAEIGVASGWYSNLMFRRIPNLHLLLVDPWLCYPGYVETPNQETYEKMYNEVLEKFKDKPHTIIRDFSVNASEQVPNGSLDFVYIDGNHDFLHITQDISYWYPKVRKGGIISGHDFVRYRGNPMFCHVKDVVQAWVYAYGISPWFVTRDRSWFWVKNED